MLAGAIFNGGLKHIAAGANSVAVQRGINNAALAACDAITAMAQKCKGKGDLEKVATVSANHDTVIGKLIAEAIDKGGADGVVVGHAELHTQVVIGPIDHRLRER